MKIFPVTITSTIGKLEEKEKRRLQVVFEDEPNAPFTFLRVALSKKIQDHCTRKKWSVRAKVVRGPLFPSVFLKDFFVEARSQNSEKCIRFGIEFQIDPVISFFDFLRFHGDPEMWSVVKSGDGPFFTKTSPRVSVKDTRTSCI